MRIEIEKGLVINVEYDYTPYKKSNSYYDPDQEEELVIDDIELEEGTIIDLFLWGDLKKLEALTLKQLKDEMAEAPIPYKTEAAAGVHIPDDCNRVFRSNEKEKAWKR